MKKLTYKHKKFTKSEVLKRFIYLFIFINFTIFFYASSELKDNILNIDNIFIILLGTLLLLMLDSIAIYYLTPEQVVTVNPIEKTLSLSHSYVLSTKKNFVDIPFSKVKNISVIKQKNKNYNIQIDLNNGISFNLFDHGNYIDYDFNNVMEHFRFIESIILPEKQFFLDKTITNKI